MTDNPTEVYRTTDPEIIAAWDATAEAKAKWIREVGDFCEKHSGSRKFYGSNFLGEEYFDGPLAPESGELPDGWRRSPRVSGMMLPDRRTAVGKELARQVKQLKLSPSFGAALAGMPDEVDGGYTDRGSFKTFSCGARRLDDCIEVTWSVAVPADRVGDQWVRVPLSQWHAEREAKA